MRDISQAHLARSVSHLTDEALLRRLARLVTRDRVTTAALLARIAEVDARRLYAPAGYPSMHAYCVGELRLSEDAAAKRIQSARAARRIPALLEALAEGRLHLSAICLLAPHITPGNGKELIAAATHRSKAEIEAMLWRRFSPSGELRLAPGPASGGGTAVQFDRSEHAPGHVGEWPAETVTPSLGRTSLHVAILKSTHEKLRDAQALLSHAIPSGDTAEVLDRALDALIARLEQRKFGAGAARRRCAAVAPRVASGTRYIPCRTHNQYEAERVFGAGFMENKREEARRAKAEARARVRAEERAHDPAQEHARDVYACLRSLGCRAGEAKRAAERAAALHGVTLEERLRAALQEIGRRALATTVPAPDVPVPAAPRSCGGRVGPSLVSIG